MLSNFVGGCTTCCSRSFGVRRCLNFSNTSCGLGTLGSCSGDGNARLCLVVSRCSGFAGGVLDRRKRTICRTLARTRNFCHSFFGLFGKVFRHVVVVKIDPIAIGSLGDNCGVNAGLSVSPVFGVVLKFDRGRMQRVVRCCERMKLVGIPASRLVASVGP